MILTIKAPGTGATIATTVLPAFLVGTAQAKWAAAVIRDVARRMGLSSYALDYSVVTV